MEQSFASQVARCLHSHQRKLRGYQVLFVLASIVVFCTVYALMMPAVTLSNEVVCGMEAHTHSDSCYTTELVGPQPELVCGAGESGEVLLHQHNEFCYNDRGELICTLPELESHTHGPDCYQEKRTLLCQETQQLGHTHSGSCYAYSKGEMTCTWTEPEDAHTHTDACYETSTRRVLTCGQTEGGAHTHGESCYVTGIKEVLTCGQTEAEAHTHDESCYTVRTRERLTCGQTEAEAHTHDESCYTVRTKERLTCGQAEAEAHTHGDSCYTVRTREILSCTQGESEDVYDEAGNLLQAGHSHGSGCYTTEEERVLTCSLSEGGGHSHDSGCYTAEEERVLTCGRTESGGHVHDGGCYTTEEERVLTCGSVEGSGHVHDSGCYTEQETRELVCTAGEGEGHTHTDACYTEETEQKLLCAIPETERHVHSDKCYAWEERLVCQETESEPGHVHTDACYEITEVLSCRRQELSVHTHDETCFDQTGSLTCALAEVGVHQHTAACVHRPEGESHEEQVLCCGLEEHAHTDACYLDVLPPLDEEYLCGMTEHIHKAECYFEDGALRCTLLEHIHDESCLEVEIPASPLESGVYLSNTFEFDNDEFHMVFHIDGYAPMKSAAGTEPPASPPAGGAESPAPGQTEAPAGPETPGQTEPPAGPEAPEQPETPAEPAVPEQPAPPAEPEIPSQTPAEGAGVIDNAEEDSGIMPLSMGDSLPVEGGTDRPLPPAAEPEYTARLRSEDVAFTVEPLTEEAAEYQRYSQQVSELMEDETPLLLQVMSLSAAIRSEALGIDEELDLSDCEIQVEITLSDAVVEAVTGDASRPALIDGYEDQAPAEEDVSLTLVACNEGTESESLKKVSAPVVGAPEAQAAPPTVTLKLAKGSDNFSVTLLKNVYPNYTVEYYAKLQRPDTSGGDVQLPFIDTSAAGNEKDHAVLPSNNNLSLKVTNLQLHDLGNKKAIVMFHEELTEVFRPAKYVFNPREQDGLTVADLDGLRGAEYDPEQPPVRQNDHYELVEFWVLNPKPADSGVDDEAWEKNENNWTKYAKSAYQSFRFTNDPEAAREGVILISEGSKFRLVYDPTSGDYTNSKTTFYDYDITDGKSYADTGRTAESADRYSGERWMYIDKQGINSTGNYTGAAAGDQLFGFGNSIATGRQNHSINKGNTSNYGSCSFRIVDGIDDDGNVHFSADITGPKIFGSQPAAGKTTYKDYDLFFDRQGDTYTLSEVIGTEAKGLDQFELVFDGLDWKKQPKKIWSNSFWPMDSAPSYGTPDHDIKFGAEDDSVKIVGSGDMLESDDKKNHNAYFGMNFAISFTLPKEYVGPLEYYFYGDDDMWVFLDGKLICDIGGVHTSVGEYVDLWDYIEGDRYDRTDDATYTLNFFYTERGASGSTCWMQYTLPNATAIPVVTPPEEGKTMLTVTKDVDGNVKPEDADTRLYDFAIKVEGVTNQYSAELRDAQGRLCNSDGSVIESPEPDQVSFKLKGGLEQAFVLGKGWTLEVENLPNHAQYTIEERNVPEGCHPHIVRTVVRDGKTVVDEPTAPLAGGSVGNSQITIAYTNSFDYELPETGGAGLLWYTLTGALLPAVTGGLWYRKRKSRREGAVD